MINPPAIRVENLSFAYEGVPVLSDVSFAIDPGDFVCMIGPNGGGKTTLIKLMLGLLKPATGRIEIFGQNPEAARAGIGYVPQYFQFDMSFPITVLDVVLMGRLDRHLRFGRYSRSDKRVAGEALGAVELEDLQYQPFAALSGGQRQRVLIARALATEPKLFFLDEPTANIDPAVQDELFDLLRRLNERLTIVMVTHDVGFVSTLVKNVVCVNHGVWVHATRELTGANIFDLYGRDVNLVRHEHRHSEKEP